MNKERSGITLGRRPISTLAREPSSVQLLLEGDRAAFITDDDARIVTWNRAAEELLGYRAASVRGKPVHEVLQTRDLFGNRICCECGVRETLQHGEQVRRHVISVVTASGGSMLVVVLARALEPSSSGTRIYELRPDARRWHEDRRASNRQRQRASADLLTASEQKVLALLTAGKRAQDVASSLGVSLATVRNHIQHLFRKLGVHTQVEAISLAHRNGLV